MIFTTQNSMGDEFTFSYDHDNHTAIVLHGPLLYMLTQSIGQWEPHWDDLYLSPEYQEWLPDN